MIVPYHYQEDAIGALFQYFYGGGTGNPVVALPTGTGKSVVIAAFCQRALQWWPSTRILIVTHVKELVKQDFDELLELWPTAPAGIYSAGLKRRDLHYPITFCGIGSIVNRIEHFGHIDLVLVDECHMVSHKSDTMYSKAMLALASINRSVRAIGLSATPFRLGLGMITEGGLFTDVVCDWCTMDRFNQLVDEGYLAPLIPKMTHTELDVENVGVSGGEFIESQLQEACDQEAVTRAALQETLSLAGGRYHWMVFCTGTAHADHTCAILEEMGVSAVCVHTDLPGFDPRFTPLKGETPRDTNIRAFKEGRVVALVSVGMVTTGFNYRPVDLIVMLRPTMSPVLWIQMLGRGTRPSLDTGKVNCLVLDFAANTRRLGPINDPVVPKKKGKKGKGAPPYKVCPHCNTYNHARARFCIQCQGEFPEHVAIQGQASEHELIRKERKEPVVEPSTIETFDVDRVDYAKHISRDQTKPPSLKITYYCGYRAFTEWVCLEHPGFAGKKARDTWRKMAAAYSGIVLEDPPATVDAALAALDQICVPKRVTVLLKAKHSDVLDYEFPYGGQQKSAQQYFEAMMLEDDIPF